MNEKQKNSNTSILARMLQSLLSFTLTTIIVLTSLIILTKPNLQEIIKWYKSFKQLQSTSSKSFLNIKNCPSLSNIQAIKQHINSLTYQIEKKLEFLNTMVLYNTKKEQNLHSGPIINILEI
ncbi:MAG: hypothetical protein ACTSYF_12915 [Promethearchaeota archaeon]